MRLVYLMTVTNIDHLLYIGFGGSNAHVILEQYTDSGANPTDRPALEHPASTNFTPFVFSAVSEGSLVAQLQATLIT